MLVRPGHPLPHRLARLLTSLAVLAGACACVPAALADGVPPPTGGAPDISLALPAPPPQSPRPAPNPTAPTATPPVAPDPGATARPFGGRGMWIWQLAKSSGGDPEAIAAQAVAHGVTTVFVKSSDGRRWWPQFSPDLIGRLHLAGLQVCAWQYVYGSHPVAEARLGAAARRTGADCLVIDAEGEYEGRYIAAQRYMRVLRRLVGASYPIGLAGFPYVDYHPAFPYSVFLAPGAAQVNLPQMYWRAIGVTVDRAYAHTYAYNRLFDRPIAPLGQLYRHPPAAEIQRFRQLSVAYGAPGLSWWDWQEASPGGWDAISAPLQQLFGFAVDSSVPILKRGARGDLVVWAQERLITAGQRVPATGLFRSQTQAAVMGFQTASGLPVTGVIDPTTWQALLRFPPAAVRWTARGARSRSATASAAAGEDDAQPVPRSARLPAVRDELAPAAAR